jgi:hypothetical protein
MVLQSVQRPWPGDELHGRNKYQGLQNCEVLARAPGPALPDGLLLLSLL